MVFFSWKSFNKHFCLQSHEPGFALIWVCLCIFHIDYVFFTNYLSLIAGKLTCILRFDWLSCACALYLLANVSVAIEKENWERYSEHPGGYVDNENCWIHRFKNCRAPHVFYDKCSRALIWFWTMTGGDCMTLSMLNWRQGKQVSFVIYLYYNCF